MRIIFFDIDGTLVLTNGAGKIALCQTFKEDFQVEKPDADIDYGGRTDLSIAKELFALNGLDHPNANELMRFFDGYVKRLSYELSHSSGVVLPGVAPLLESLYYDDRYQLGIITGNIELGASTKLTHYGIDHYFSFGGYGDREHERDGIAREGLQKAGERLAIQLQGHQCVVIGDTPHDISCSRAIGAFSIGVCTGYATSESIAAEKPTALVESLSDTDQILSLLDEFYGF